MQGEGEVGVLGNLTLSYFSLLSKEESILHRPQFLRKIPAHVCAPLHSCSPCQETCSSMGSPWVAAFLGAHPPAPVWGPPQAAGQSHLVPGAPPSLFSLTLNVCRMFIFHSLLSQLLSSTFYPFLFITEVLATPAYELSFGQWQVHLGSGWRNDCLTWAHPLLPSSTSPPCIPQSLATQNHYISKAEVSAVLKSFSSFCPLFIYNEHVLLKYILHLQQLFQQNSRSPLYLPHYL